MSLDPDQDKVQYQWIHAKAALGEPEDAVTRYRNWVAAAPGDVRWLRLLSGAYLQARDFGAAAEVIGTGLGLSPGDPKLTAKLCRSTRAEARSPQPGCQVVDGR